MKVLILTVAVLGVLAGCSSKETSADAREKLDKKWEPQVGKATKAEFIEVYGNADWCKPGEGGEETCRFLNKKGTKWMGEKTDRKHIVTTDDIIAEFDPSGRLRYFKSTAQR